MLEEFLRHSRRIVVILFLACVALDDCYCVAGPLQYARLRLHSNDWSRATYYGYPPILDHLPAGSRVLDRHHRGILLAGAKLTNSVQPLGDIWSADYIAKTGPPDRDDIALQAGGAVLIYNGIPPSLFPKVAVPWRIYKLR
jgi:hypothetical protein